MLLQDAPASLIHQAASALARSTVAPVDSEQARQFLNGLSFMQSALAEMCGIDQDLAATDPAFTSYYNRVQDYLRCGLGIEGEDVNLDSRLG